MGKKMSGWKYYWHVETNKKDIWLHSDVLEIKDGHLIFYSQSGLILCCFSPGNWMSVNAASILDGGNRCIQHEDLKHTEDK